VSSQSFIASFIYGSNTVKESERGGANKRGQKGVMERAGLLSPPMHSDGIRDVGYADKERGLTWLCLLWEPSQRGNWDDLKHRHSATVPFSSTNFCENEIGGVIADSSSKDIVLDLIAIALKSLRGRGPP
jgi:hypothetical protein